MFLHPRHLLGKQAAGSGGGGSGAAEAGYLIKEDWDFQQMHRRSEDGPA